MCVAGFRILERHARRDEKVFYRDFCEEIALSTGLTVMHHRSRALGQVLWCIGQRSVERYGEIIMVLVTYKHSWFEPRNGFYELAANAGLIRQDAEWPERLDLVSSYLKLMRCREISRGVCRSDYVSALSSCGLVKTREVSNSQGPLKSR